MTELEKAAYEWSPGEEDSRYDFMAGAKWAFQNRDVEKVLCAACKFLLGGEEIITTGYRHDQAIAVGDKYFWNWKTYSKLEDYFDYTHFRMTEVQGFLTTQNRFVDREEAAKIAYSAGQIASPKTKLYSEDLY